MLCFYLLCAGENIFNLLDSALTSRGVSWRNCLALGCDNASVMTGRHKGVFAFVKEQQPSVFLSGCTLHVVHNAGKKAASHLPSIEAALHDIYYYFEKSSDRQQRYKGTQALYDVDQRKILKHVCTRWLSIGRCVDRLLENWEALKEFFKTEKAKLRVNEMSSYAANKVDAILSFLRSPTNKLYTLFLSYTLKVFEEFLLSFQAEEPKVHLMRGAFLRLLRTILSRFVKPSAFTGKTVDQVEYKLPYNLKDNKDLIIGDAARDFLAKKEENHLRDSKVEEFYSSVKKYFTALVDYLKDHLPLEDPVLRHAEVTDILRKSGDLSSVRFFLERYPCLLPKGVTADVVIEQFVELQCSDVSSCSKPRLDETWKAIGQFQDETCDTPFSELSMVMRGILTIPHSSAHCERIFSCVRKNRTPQRSSLSDGTLESLLVVKSTKPAALSDAALDDLKSCYYKSLCQKDS